MFTNTTLPAGRKRRSFTRAFKAEVAAQCLQSGEAYGIAPPPSTSGGPGTGAWMCP